MGGDASEIDCAGARGQAIVVWCGEGKSERCRRLSDGGGSDKMGACEGARMVWEGLASVVDGIYLSGL